jgi:hypothetical protein
MDSMSEYNADIQTCAEKLDAALKEHEDMFDVYTLLSEHGAEARERMLEWALGRIVADEESKDIVG